MRVSKAEKEKSRARIVASAARLLRERGVEGCGVAEVMNDAGLTHGGFYRHFETKDALVAAALDLAFQDILSILEAAPAAQVGDAGLGPSGAFIQRYLSDGHVASPGQGCPIPSLSGDVGRAGDDLRARFSQGVRRIVVAMANPLTGSRSQRETRALRQLAMMAGAVAIARASDQATATAVLTACRGARA